MWLLLICFVCFTHFYSLFAADDDQDKRRAMSVLWKDQKQLDLSFLSQSRNTFSESGSPSDGLCPTERKMLDRVAEAAVGNAVAK